MGFPSDPSSSNLPASAEDIRDAGSILGQEESLEESMKIHSRILAWEIPSTEVPGRLEPPGCKSQTWLNQLSMHAHITEIFYLLKVSQYIQHLIKARELQKCVNIRL